jgi:hypothetical protein
LNFDLVDATNRISEEKGSIDVVDNSAGYDLAGICFDAETPIW